MAKPNLDRKLKHAEYHRARMDDYTPGSFEYECELSAFLAPIRSLTQYVQRELQSRGKGWPEIDAWAKSQLPSGDFEKWATLKKRRDEDIHVQPVAATIEAQNTISILDITALAPPFSTKFRCIVKHPENGKEYEVKDLFDIGLATARKLIAEYMTL